MHNLHQKLTQKYPSYHNWHQTKHHNKVHWGVLIGFVLLVFAVSQQTLAAPTTPTNLAAAAISSTQINLSWTVSSDDEGVTGYKIYRCSGSTCAPTTQIGTSATNSFSDTGLAASTTYAYAVSAYDAAGNESIQSNPPVSATTQSTISPEPFCLGGISPDPNVIFCDDFESGNLSAWDFVWTTDDVKTSTQTVFQGSNSAEFHFVLGSGGAQHRDVNRMIEKILPTQQEHIFTRGYFYFGTPLNNANLQRKLIRIQAPSGPEGMPYAWWEVVATNFDYKLAIAECLISSGTSFHEAVNPAVVVQPIEASFNFPSLPRITRLLQFRLANCYPIVVPSDNARINISFF